MGGSGGISWDIKGIGGGLHSQTSAPAARCVKGCREVVEETGEIGGAAAGERAAACMIAPFARRRKFGHMSEISTP